LTALSNIGVIILGAGSSSRLGQAKQLLKYEEKTLLQRVLDTLKTVPFSSKVVVLGANAEEIMNSTEAKDVKFVINTEWEEGIASSIRTGMRQVLDFNPALEHILFLLTDQPFVSDHLIHELLKKHLDGKNLITGSKYNNIVGVPAIFEKSIFPDLLKLSGDHGARYIINQDPKKVATVNFELGHFDVDTQEDYKKLLKYKQ
jgi:molybdenum cofactor cytidylyltransferase